MNGKDPKFFGLVDLNEIEAGTVRCGAGMNERVGRVYEYNQQTIK